MNRLSDILMKSIDFLEKGSDKKIPFPPEAEKGS
jgi:hypothetical protein